MNHGKGAEREILKGEKLNPTEEIISKLSK